MTTINRLTFLKTAGVAAGTAAITTSPALAAAIEPGTARDDAQRPDPERADRRRDPQRGSRRGDRALRHAPRRPTPTRVLVQRLLKAAGQNHKPVKRQGVA